MHIVCRARWLLTSALMVSGCIAGSIGVIETANAAVAPPFAQCPAVAASPTCGAVADFTTDSKGATKGAIIVDPKVGPYDGSDDGLVGAVNETKNTITKVQLTGPDIFGFDGDGIATYTGKSYGVTGYEGPNTSFTYDPSKPDIGIVNFIGGLLPGHSLYFSLEGDPSIIGTGSVGPVSMTPIPGAMSLAVPAFAGFGTLAWRRRRRP